MKIVVLAGGNSPERDVSWVSARAVKTTLEDLGHEVTLIDPGPDLPLQLWQAKQAGCEFVWNGLHGGAGENGTIQAILDYLELPYQGSGMSASLLGMDKALSKQLFLANQIPTPPYQLWRPGDPPLSWEGCVANLGSPLVLKPTGCGSTVGVAIVKQGADWQGAWQGASSLGQAVLAETYIPGVELTVSILDGLVLPLIEIVPTQGDFYDYEAKYAPGGSRHVIPPRLPEEVQEQAAAISRRAYQVLGCQGLARVDLRVDPQGRCWVLEVNTLPGMTPTSLCPDAAAAWGWSFADLVDKMLSSALRAHQQRLLVND
ncbi:MAG: D-alanine--D-alanine ligase [Thermostichales cyanobacterium GMQP_bins_62]